MLRASSTLPTSTSTSTSFKNLSSKIRRGPKLEGYAFANFGYSSETDGESHHEMGINFGLSKCCALTCFWPDL